MTTSFWIKALTLVALAGMVGLAAATWNDLLVLIEILRSHWLGKTFLRVGELLLAVNVLVFVWRVVLVIKYRPAAACGDEQLPTCCVVVPAYNEGKHVLSTLRSLIRSDYPADKLQIIAVDDGSKDDTWHWLEQAAAEHDGRIEIVRMPRNQGKRHALYEGFRRSHCEILVTVDSDSVVERQAVRRLVSPFVHDLNVGAVAGNIRVLNRHEGLIPRMLDVSFAYSFDFMRASQSMVDTVMCTPGALAAYRRGPLMDVLEEWVAQTFCGQPANIGEDRALTNLILREGHLCRFQGDSICYTNVPADYNGLCRMFIRWARSNVRETLAMAAFIFGKFRPGSSAGARINLIHQAIGMFITPVMMAIAMGFLAWRPGVYVVHILLGTAVTSTVPAVFYAARCRGSNSLWAYPYGFFWLVFLAWINPYSLLTFHKSGWLTRQLAPSPQAAQSTAAASTAEEEVQKSAA